MSLRKIKQILISAPPGAVLAVLVSTFVFPCVIGHSIWQMEMNKDVLGWKSAEGTIISIELLARSARVEYTYSFKGKHFVGNRIAYLNKGSILEKKYIQAKYQRGDTVGVFLNPLNPSMAVLEYRPNEITYFKSEAIIFFMSCFMFAGGATVTSLSLRKVKHDTGTGPGP